MTLTGSLHRSRQLYVFTCLSSVLAFADTHHQRDKLIASVRRNSRLAYLRMQEQTESTKKGAQEAYAALTDKLIDSWSESQLKEFCDKNGINGWFSISKKPPSS